MEKMATEWITGEELLMSGRYMLPDLLKACNNGELTIFDPKKQKHIIPVAQLKSIKRIFNRPTSFCIPISPNKPHTIIMKCEFVHTSSSIWKELFKKYRRTCWQEFNWNASSMQWNFSIPEELCDINYILEHQIEEKKKYQFIFTETSCVSSLARSNICQVTVGHFTSTTRKTALKLEMWYELLNNGGDVAWYIYAYNKTIRAFDAKCHNVSNGKYKKDTNSYELLLSDQVMALSWNRDNSISLDKIINQVESNCNITKKAKLMADALYKDNISRFRSFLMDTEYEYESPAMQPGYNYETFIFDPDHYSKRHFYFSPDKGVKIFQKCIKSFLYRPTQALDDSGLAPTSKQGSIEELCDIVRINPSQLKLSTTSKKDSGLVVEVKRLIGNLRHYCFTLLFQESERRTEKELYFELRWKGIDSTSAARILYWPDDAGGLYRKDGDIPSQYVCGDKPNSANPDAILNYSRDTIMSKFKNFSKEWKNIDKNKYDETDYIKILQKDDTLI